jgi:hypothetical protein
VPGGFFRIELKIELALACFEDGAPNLKDLSAFRELKRDLLLTQSCHGQEGGKNAQKAQ